MPRSRRWTFVLVPVLVAIFVGCQPSVIIPPLVPTSTGTAYYVDCSTGSDADTGRTEASAWKTITKANQAPMVAGDVMMFKRGCTWDRQRLEAAWDGTSTKPIKIGAFGSGALPRIRNGSVQNVRITGSYLIVQDLDLSYDVKARSGSSCSQPVGDYYDVTFSLDAHHNTLQRSTITTAMTGVLITPGARYNKVIDNTIANNNVMKTWGGDPELVLGAWGVLINGDDNEVANNVFWDNNADCPSVSNRYPGNSVEIYEGSRNHTHHNRAYGDRVFSELGGSDARLAADNVFAYNLFVTSIPESRFVITRGAADTAWGPVLRTKVQHNTTYQTGARSQGVVCGGLCRTDILTMSGNIIWAEEKALYADEAFTEHHNVFWSTDGTPMVQIERKNGTAPVTKLPLASTSQIINPRFAGAANSNFRLQAASPAIDEGGVPAGYISCLGTVALPQGAATDAGAYEVPA